MLNNENYLPFLNYSKKKTETSPPNLISPTSQADDSQFIQVNDDTNNKSGDLSNSIEQEIENNEPIFLNIDEDEIEPEEDVAIIPEEPKPIKEKPIIEDPDRPASNWFFSFLNWLEWLFKKFWWLLLLLLLILLLLLDEERKKRNWLKYSLKILELILQLIQQKLSRERIVLRLLVM